MEEKPIKKAVVVGGSSGIGLAISKELISRGYFIEICSRTCPEKGILDEKSFHHHACDLLYFNEDLFRSLAADENVEILMVTSGFGRVADFQYFHIAEIEKMMTVDAVSIIKIFRLFYERLNSERRFYAGVMGSISGYVSTPSAAVYAAAKASVVRFVESINIELEANGASNRVLDVSPGAFDGSSFRGGKTNLPILKPLADAILEHIFAQDVSFIPQYDDVYRGVIERYHSDRHAFGLQSYEYKEKSGRKQNQKKVVIGYLSGTFDLFHIGHLNLLRRAKQNCDYLIVGVHTSGKWKGKETFVPLEERKTIVSSCRFVDKVVDACVEDSDAYNLWHYDRLFVGSDYKGTERFQKYEEYFKDKGVEIIYFPYTTSTSSTELRQALHLKIDKKQ